MKEDLSLWKTEKGKYKKKFSTKKIWLMIRERHMLCSWHQVVWFKHATPRYSFILWTSIHGKLSTGDRMQNWSSTVDVSCVLCKCSLETRDHLFFVCPYSTLIWETLAKNVMGDQYTREWECLLNILSDGLRWNKLSLFITRHLFQSAVHAIWGERNRRRHGEESLPSRMLIKRIDKKMRNKFTVIRRRGDIDYEEGMALWFSTR